MEMLRLKYIGGKSVSKLYYQRVRYVFNKANNFIADVPSGAWNFVKGTNEFIPAPIAQPVALEPDVVEDPPIAPVDPDEHICDVCGFKAKSALGLLSHKRSHKKEEEEK